MSSARHDLLSLSNLFCLNEYHHTASIASGAPGFGSLKLSPVLANLLQIEVPLNDPAQKVSRKIPSLERTYMTFRGIVNVGINAPLKSIVFEKVKR
jgi:hypothetical protein